METQFTPQPRNDYRDDLLVPTAAHASAVSWCAVFAGAVASAALSLILLFLGTGFGLTLVSPWAGEGISGTTFTITSIVGVTVISLLASALGGYLAGRLRNRWLDTPADEVYFRDTAHGFLSWAVATLGTAALLSTVTGAILNTGVKAGAAVAEGSAVAAGALHASPSADRPGSNEASLSPLPYLLDSLLRRDSATTSTAIPQGQPDQTGAVDDPSYSPAVSSGVASRATFPGSAAEHSRLSRELGRIYVQAIAAGSLPQEDVRYAGQLVAQYAGIDQATAEKRVTDTFARLQTALSDAEKAAKEAADEARKATAYTSLWLFVSLLIGAFIASLMAVCGGRQRDF